MKVRTVEHISIYNVMDEISTLVLDTESLSLVDTTQRCTGIVGDDGVCYAYGPEEVARLLKVLPATRRKHIKDRRGIALYQVIS